MKALDRLKAALPACVFTDDEMCFRSSFDGMKLSFKPDAVVKAKNENDVVAVVKLANEYKISLTTRGTGSTLTGAATPVKGGWVLDISALNSLEINVAENYVRAGAGVITGDIQKLADSNNRMYPPDPSSSGFCTIGGNLACNAGGLRGCKYGVTRDYVLGLRAVMPNGDVFEWGKSVRKFATGYNIRDLLIGSEGTLAIITEVTLRIIPKPETSWTCVAGFNNNKDALDAALALMASGILPSIMEFMDGLSVSGAEEFIGHKLLGSDQGSTPSLLIELDGYRETVARERSVAAKIISEKAMFFSEADDSAHKERLWSLRRSCSPAMFKHGKSKLNEDVVVPLSQANALITTIEKVSSEYGLKIPVFGHAGDGNYHVNIMYNQEDLASTQRAFDALDRIMNRVVELGGAISGEHGIGLAKTNFLSKQFSQPQIDWLKAVKNSFDPNGILNPGKIFEIFKPWEHYPVKVKMPWENDRKLL